MTKSGYLNATVEQAFNRLFMGRIADEIGLFALEEACAALYRAGMTAADLVQAVRAEYRPVLG